MIYFTENEIDSLLEDDLPAGDMTSFLMNIAGHRAGIRLKARHRMVVCCTEEVERLYRKAGLEVLFFLPTGTEVDTGDLIAEARGDAYAVHSVWRTGTALLEFASGVALRTRTLVDAVRNAGSDATVAGTRKHPPYMKKVALKALMAGGAVPHRTGLSDTILIFREHLLFSGGYDNLPSVISSMKSRQKERKIVVEAHDEEQAEIVVRSGADAVQVDKMEPDRFGRCAVMCRGINPSICMIAAGGINSSNAHLYAAEGADVLVSSWIYFAQPADIKAEITPLD